MKKAAVASLLIIRASDAVQRAKALAQTAVEADQKGHVNQAILGYRKSLEQIDHALSNPDDSIKVEDLKKFKAACKLRATKVERASRLRQPLLRSQKCSHLVLRRSVSNRLSRRAARKEP